MGIKPKYGECSECKNGKEVLLYRRAPAQCKYHYQKQKKEQYLERQKAKGKPKKRVKIKNFSNKKAEQLKEYREKRDRYLKNNRYCEVDDCGMMSTNLHHKAGRNGDLLTDENYFMACCSECHPRRIHENPSWAREKGYILTVNKK